ncbi:MAG: hypothetical protein P4L35_07905 [Ignavibacteriaceae bacterium]|nr:hypothetical protein [Ignavibacteriaceae bacterium]
MFLVIFSINLFSQDLSKQQLDKLYNDFIKSRTLVGNANTSLVNQHIKCNFALINSVRLHFNNFTLQQQQTLKQLLTRPTLQTSLVSPSGYYRIHYDTAGINRPNYGNDTLFYTHLNEVAVAADSAYNFEINYLGYPVPPSDNGAGGDDKYDIYLEYLGDVYGDTQFDFTSGEKGPTYTEVNSDFTGFPTTGLDAVRVTIAHEFHHAIQIGDYIYRDTDVWFHEMTSVSMEHFVYGSIHDYYYYMSHYFDNPNRSIAENDVSSGDGYDVAIWNIYMQKKFDFDIIKRQWELMPIYRAVTCFNQSLVERNAFFSQVLNEFGVWAFYTDVRKKFAPPDKFFPEGDNYPLLNIPTIQLSSNATVNGSSFPISNNYMNLNIQAGGETDSLIPIISNADYLTAVNSADSAASFQYQVSTSSFTSSTDISGKYYVKLNSQIPQFWVHSEILNNLLTSEGAYTSSVTDFPFPSPFKYDNPVNTYIYIPVDKKNSNKAYINVYTVGMKLVYSSTAIIETPFGNPVIKWKPRNNNNEKLSSGIYIYAVNSGGMVKKGKLVIFN